MTSRIKKVNPDTASPLKVFKGNGNECPKILPFHPLRHKKRDRGNIPSSFIPLQKLARWIVLGLVGSGITGTYVQNHIQSSSYDQKVLELTEKIKGLEGRVTFDKLSSIINEVSPSTVMIEGEVENINIFSGTSYKSKVFGSGVIVKDIENNKYILTNGHVTKGSDLFRTDFKDSVYHVRLYNGSDFENPIEFDTSPVILSNGERAYSPQKEQDIAVLTIPPDIKLPQNIGVKIRDTNKNPIKLGEALITIGNPFGNRDSIGFGIASHINRKSSLNKNHHIQTDAAINPGNSGGGLFDIEGDLVGINTWTYLGGNGVGGSIRIDSITDTLKSWGIQLSSD